jgi:Lon protease-like protein
VIELPLFPLNTVLFPEGFLPLRIFEPRYVDMVGRCMREGSPFGVILIRSGAEVGEVKEIAEFGTSAVIVDFNNQPDGLLGITCRGERKFRVLNQSQRADGLYMGEVEYLEPESKVELPYEYRTLAELLRKMLPAFGEPYTSMPTQFDDASWVGSRLAELMPVSLADKLTLLRYDDPVARLEWFRRIRVVPVGSA